MMLQNKFLLLILSFCFMLLANNYAVSQESNLTGKQIVQKMAAQYASAKSYQDEGVVYYSGFPFEKQEVTTFKTYFVRPNKLRFEWEDKVDYLPKRWHIVWSNGKETFTFWESEEIEKEESLGLGIAGATGVSSGSAHTVPSLLTKEIGGYLITEITSISLSREEQFEGEDCFVVKGLDRTDEPVYLWISKREFLLRKIREKVGDVVKEEIRRNVKLNETIPAKVFQFKPPKSVNKSDAQQINGREGETATLLSTVLVKF